MVSSRGTHPSWMLAPLVPLQIPTLLTVLLACHSTRQSSLQCKNEFRRLPRPQAPTPWLPSSIPDVIQYLHHKTGNRQRSAISKQRAGFGVHWTKAGVARCLPIQTGERERERDERPFRVTGAEVREAGCRAHSRCSGIRSDVPRRNSVGRRHSIVSRRKRTRGAVASGQTYHAPTCLYCATSIVRPVSGDTPP